METKTQIAEDTDIYILEPQVCSDEEPKYYKVKDSIEIPYFKKKQLPNDCDIVGFLCPKDKPETDDVYCLALDENNIFKVREKKGLFKANKGFVYVGEDLVIGITKNIIPFPIFWFLVGIMLTLITVSILKLDIIPKPKETTNIITKEPIMADQEVFDGFYKPEVEQLPNMVVTAKKVYWVDENNNTIPLLNDEKNPYYVSYCVIDADTGDVLLDDTGLIEPGNATNWDCSPYMVNDTLNLSFTLTGYTMDTQETCCSVTVDNIEVRRQ